MRKYLAVLLAIVVGISTSVTAFAGGPDDGTIYAGGVIPEDPISTAEYIQKIKSEPTYTVEQKNILINELLEHEKTTFTLNRATSAMTLSGFPYHYQLSSYWCVPACVQMTLEYTNATTYNQSTIASELGVDNTAGLKLSEAVSYLNNKQNHANYTQIVPDSVSEMKNDFYDIMDGEDAPAIISTIFTTNEGYPYNMSYYHALCVTGQTANGASFRLHDPIYNAAVPESYYITASNIYVGLSNYLA